MDIWKKNNVTYEVDVAETYIGLSRLFKPAPIEFEDYRENHRDIHEIFEHLMSAIDIYEICLGFDHPDTADCYSKVALAYQEQGEFEAASPWIRRAFVTFYKVFGPDDPITLNTLEFFKTIEINIDSRLDQVPTSELSGVILDLEKN